MAGAWRISKGVESQVSFIYLRFKSLGKCQEGPDVGESGVVSFVDRTIPSQSVD